MTCQPKNMDLTISPFDNSWQKKFTSKDSYTIQPKENLYPYKLHHPRKLQGGWMSCVEITYLFLKH